MSIERNLKIRLYFDGRSVDATLLDSSAARDFERLLPLDLTLLDCARTERTSVLPQSLSTQGTPDRHEAKRGDITYYAPLGTLSIFHRDFGRALGLVKLGKIDGDIETLRAERGPVSVRVESLATRALGRVA